MELGNPAASRLNRRGLIWALGASLATPLLAGCAGGYEKLPAPTRPGSRLDGLMPGMDAWLDVTNAHTGERVALRFAEGGHLRPRAVRRLDWVFRDWRANRDPDIDPRVYWSLAALSSSARSQGQSGRITLLSGYRTRRTTRLLQSQGAGASSNSYHMRRRAADIRVEGMPEEEVAAMAEWLQVGGVGRYGGFTHVDTGPIRTWHG
jgi:uncharacterized protein YcbK (DUF882 family)